MDATGFGPQPTAVVCPNCGTFIMTALQRRSSNLTHFAAFVLCLCGCWPCCLVPYCVDTCKIIHHHCPSCHQLLGVYRPWWCQNTQVISFVLAILLLSVNKEMWRRMSIYWRCQLHFILILLQFALHFTIN